MRQCAGLWFRHTIFFLSAPSPSTGSSSGGGIQGFYSALDDDGLNRRIEVPDMSIELLPFQKEGIGWMAQRELRHVGGIMADHLGMGKTVQMIGLCLTSDKVSRLRSSSEQKRKGMIAEGNRLLTVVRQMRRISVIANCTRINRPGKDLQELAQLIDDEISTTNCDYRVIRVEVDKWLAFGSKFHPTYSKRAGAFLNDEEKRDFQFIESKELRTLVVVPAALMLQWKSEIESKIKKARKPSVYLYHGNNKWVSSTELETYDFVVTTYDTLSNSALDAFIPSDDGRSFAFSRRDAGPLFHVLWKRIILDEAHMIRHSKTQRWRAVRELQGVHRWAVTATPLHNTIEDLQNLLFFTGVPRLPVLPGSSSESLLNDPLLQRSIARSLQPAFLRRSPVMTRNGRREVLVQLPEKVENVVQQPFTVKESRMYNSILARSRSALASSEHGEGAFHIFSMMTKLRQACCHPWINEGRAVKISFCGICNAEASGTVTTRCGHSFCQECLLLRFREAGDGDEVATRVQCPTCSQAVLFTSVFTKRPLSSAERIVRYKKHEFELSTKLKMILQSIDKMKKETPDDKMIIFSHFTSFMDVIMVAFERYNIPCLRIDGTMSLSSRNTTIRHFQQNSNIKVILASKTATGVGLNLTAANHVLVVDPWWNPAIEEQAVHRCYRIGQKKPVFITRFIISDSIEQYCYEISKRKKEFGDAILKAATSGDSGAKAAASKLHELMSRLKYVGQDDEGEAKPKDPSSKDAVEK